MCGGLTSASPHTPFLSGDLEAKPPSEWPGGICTHWIRIAVETAAQWKTYVLAHAFIDASIRIAVENGVQVIEHDPPMTEESAKLMAEIWTVSARPLRRRHVGA